MLVALGPRSLLWTFIQNKYVHFFFLGFGLDSFLATAAIPETVAFPREVVVDFLPAFVRGFVDLFISNSLQFVQDVLDSFHTNSGRRPAFYAYRKSCGDVFPLE